MQIMYLVQIIEEKGRSDFSRANAIKNMPAPRNVSFWGLANYYRNYLQNMHTLGASLNKLLKET